MKRILPMLLCLALGLGLAAPAAAQSPTDMEAALQEVTALVKETLEVDDGYTEFYGDYADGLTPGWYLRWSDDERELSVTCREDAVVTEVYVWTDGGRRDLFYGFDAAFPAIGESEARADAERWLGQLMGDGESARIDATRVTLTTDGDYRFSGHVLKNGLESPVTFDIRIDANGLAGYSRSDSYRGYVGDVPSARPAADEKSAAAALAGSVETELYYVTDAAGEARLRYVPVGAYTVVDAQTGEAVDMDALYASFDADARNGAETPMAEASMAADTGGGRALTQVELDSIANYADAMEEGALDAAMRGVKELGLSDFALVRCSYSMGSDGAITASLRYSAEMTENRLFGYSREAYEDYISWGDTPTVYKYVTADAKSGAIQSVSTSYPLWERDARTAAGAEGVADAFLKTCAAEAYAESAPCTLRGYNEGVERVYARVHDGYFFPENYLSVTVNAAVGAVDSFRRVWDEDAVFAPSKGIVSEAEAEAAYIDALDVTLGYAAWPEGIDYDDPVFARYLDWGYTWVESLRLAYYYSGTDAVSGVDALTGEAIVSEPGGGYAYDDIANDPRREMIEALGSAGIGFAGGSFRPNERLDRREALRLLVSAAGYGTGSWDDDQLRNEAVYLGFISASDWRPDDAVTRMDFIRMVIGASRYGAAAELGGVWAADFSDVPEADTGYAAIAEALGMAAGDPLRPDADCTRAAAAVMLYRFMKR